MTGDTDGSFRPNDTITRAEACRMIYSIRTNSDDASAYANMQTTFTDVPADAWYAGYVKHCQSVGIVSGRSETVFDPNSDVTGVELALMCLRVMGYDPAKANIGGSTWSTTTIGLATEAGLLEDVTTGITSACPRQWAAQIMYNMLDSRTVRWSNDSESYTDLNMGGGLMDRVGMEYLKLWIDVGTLTTVDNDTITIYSDASDVEDSDRLTDEVGPYSYTKVPADYSDLLGQKVKVLYRDGKTNDVIGVYATGESTAVEAVASAVESDGTKIKIDGTSYSIESEENGNNAIDVYFYGVNGTITDTSDDTFTNQAGTTFTASVNNGATNPAYAYNSKAFDNWDNSAATMLFVDTDGNGRLDNVFITDYAAAEVTSVTSSKLVAGKSYNFSDENIDETLETGDWAVISYDRYNDCTRIEKADVITDTLDGMKQNSTMDNKDPYNEYRIGDTWYNEAYDGSRNSGNTDINTVRAGDEVDAVAVNGVVWMIKRASGDGGLGNVPNVAMVVNKDQGLGGDQVKLQFFNDTTEVVDVDRNSSIAYGKLTPGQLYEYSVSGGEYSFTDLETTDDFYGDYTYAGEKSYTIGDDSINFKTIDDTAKVILFKDAGTDTGNDSDVITGKQLKALTPDEVGVTSDSNAEYFTADVDGLNRAAALAVSVSKLPNSLTSNDYYAYILEDAVESKGTNEISYQVLLQGSDEAITVYEENTKTSDRKANTLIGYGSLAAENSDGKRFIDDVHLYDLDKDSANFGLDAITGGNTSRVLLATAGELEYTTDSVIFYIDTDDKSGTSTIGAPSSAATKANKALDDSEGVVIQDGADKYIANALYLANGGDVEVLVVESGDRQFRGPYVDETLGVSLSATIASIEAGQNEAAVTFDLNNIPNGAKIDLTNVGTAAGATMTTVTAPATTGTLENLSSLAQGDYTLTFTVTDAEGNTLATTDATLSVGAVSIDTISAPSVDGTLKDAAPKATDVVNTLVTSASAGDATMEVTDFNVAVTNKVVSDTYALVAGDTVQVTISLQTTDGNVLASDLDVSSAAIQSVEPTIAKKTSTSVDLVYTYTVPKTVISAPTVNLTKIANGQNPTQAQATVTGTGVDSSNVVTEWYKAANTEGTKMGDADTVSTGETVSVKVILTAEDGYTFTGGTYTSIQLFSTAVSDAQISEDGNTLTLILNNQTV